MEGGRENFYDSVIKKSDGKYYSVFSLEERKDFVEAILYKMHRTELGSTEPQPVQPKEQLP